ncbi:cytochrome P450 9AG6 [Nasonia vitripennis]|uniref:Cytochrome P450 n=1 Tax=Nasonia vitripennis TaxID=7425 RepID=A0A7M6UGF0_NASVI|nr:cytochrome P450 9AG6 [Nasonia vitripennis]
MDPFFWTSILVISSLVYYYFKKKLDYFEELNIPYVPGWPLVGNFLGVFTQRQHLIELLKELYNSHPEAKYVGAFDFGTRPVIVLRDIELIKSVTIKHSDKFPDHMPLADRRTDPTLGDNLFNITGDEWKELRNVLTPSFTSSKLKMMFHLMADCADKFLKHVEYLPPEARKYVDTKDLFTRITTDIIASCGFGISVDSLRDRNNELYVLGKKSTHIEGIQGLKFLILKSFPWIVKLFKLKHVTEDVSKFFANLVSTTIRTRDAMGISRPDMLQMMMDARKKKTEHLELDMSMMTAQCFGAFFAGYESLSTFMCLVAHELAIHPDVQKKLQNEIDEVMKESNGKLNYKAINKMQYLDAVFNEIARKHPQNPFIDRRCVAHFEFPPAFPDGKPITLEPGTSIWIPVAGIHMDPKYYENPEKFDPDRYYQKKVAKNDALNLSFGIGSRSCIADRFSKMLVNILFVLLLSRFNFVRNEKTCSPLKYSRKNIIITPKGGFSLDIEARS